MWKLNKPMYGLDDSERKFYLKIKEILKNMEFNEMIKDSAFFYMRKAGNLVAMISCHVNDFKIASADDFGETKIKNIAEHLTISKIRKNASRY